MIMKEERKEGKKERKKERKRKSTGLRRDG